MLCPDCNTAVTCCDSCACLGRECICGFRADMTSAGVASLSTPRCHCGDPIGPAYEGANEHPECADLTRLIA